jgi:NAD-dependent deacetylase
MKCGKKYPADYIYESDEKVPRCECGGIIRCDVTLYEEQLPYGDVEGAVDAISNADMLIIGGTSLTVYPASSFVRYFRGKHTVIINKEHLYFNLDDENDLEINEPIGKVFECCKQLYDMVK